jgi:hypothetical protein
MAALKYYYVLTVRDEVVEADPEWVRTVYTPIACPKCRGIRPENEGAVDLQIMEEPVSPSAPVGYPITLEIFRTDFFAALQPHMPDYFFGSVGVKGKRLPRYVSVFAGGRARVKEWADQHCEYAPCRVCGRVYQYLVAGRKWFNRGEIGDRLVFSGPGGGGLYIARPLIDGLDSGLRRELKLSAVEVRDG